MFSESLHASLDVTSATVAANSGFSPDAMSAATRLKRFTASTAANLGFPPGTMLAASRFGVSGRGDTRCLDLARCRVKPRIPRKLPWRHTLSRPCEMPCQASSHLTSQDAHTYLEVFRLLDRDTTVHKQLRAFERSTCDQYVAASTQASFQTLLPLCAVTRCAAHCWKLPQLASHVMPCEALEAASASQSRSKTISPQLFSSRILVLPGVATTTHEHCLVLPGLHHTTRRPMASLPSKQDLKPSRSW